ncbi:hypothetical protein [Pseudomonas fluorescens]|uniref:Mobilization protein n=1 Tax=Pseudomonas fluorescens TaxID=294 RepID=A0A5E7QH45_PSEFL|nr:hypothetical protein [Pseudomonas fluorescens]VVP61089.1 hypothetical protein PS880_06251 [Pseudomonas fluorescens]
MTLLKTRIEATNSKLAEMKAARKIADKERRQNYKQSKADRARMVVLVGEAVLRRLERGDWDEADFKQMMDESVARPLDRELFDLE